MPRAHLTIRESPLESGSQVEALCGTEIFPAQIVLMWDSVAMDAPLAMNTLLVCRECWKLCSHVGIGDTGQRYIYGVIKGQSMSEREERERECVA